jgi:ABC-type multidrug transport system ATPase subunit
LEWLQVSQEQRRSFFFPITRYFAEKPNLLVQGSDLNPSVEESQGKVLEESELVKVSNVTKIYEGAIVRALTNVTLQFRIGEIFGLIGYNGAGKSTLINIICGILSPTYGNVTVFGLDATTKRSEIARFCGICSQADVLFSDLTARDNLYYFGLIRGVPASQISSEIQAILHDLKIDYADQVVKTLSGGQKRRLSVGVAFIHSPKLVVLDEMSSGVDPDNRRIIWSFLQKRKAGSAILLCTHFMDEAELLAERKALITTGQIISVGSTKFLKNLYATGYIFTVEKSESFNKEAIKDLFVKSGLDPKIYRENPQFIDFSLPSNHLTRIKSLEESAEFRKLVASWSLKENGLEDVFSSRKIMDDDSLSEEQEEKMVSYMEHFRDPGLFQKMFYFGHFEYKRTVSGFVGLLSRLLVPIVLTIILCILLQNNKAVDTAQTKTSTSLNFNLANQLLPENLLIQTNANFDNSRFVKIGAAPSYGITMGTLSSSGRSYSFDYLYGYVGAPLLVTLQILKSESTATIQTQLDYIEIPQSFNVLTQLSTIITIAIILDILLIEVTWICTDEVEEIKSKLKFLILSAGVPPLAFWAISFARLLILMMPLLIPIASVTYTSDWYLTSGSVVILFFQSIMLACLIGTVFSRVTARVILIISWYGLILFTTLIPLLMKNPDFALAETFSLIIPGWVPVSLMYHTIAQFAKGSAKMPTDSNYMTNAAVVHFFLYLILLVVAELCHIALPNIKVSQDRPPYVSFHEVAKIFGFRKRKIAVKNLNLTIEKNELFALLGPNGCGKTTTLSMLTSQLMPTKGDIHLEGLHVSRNKFMVIRKIGSCPQFDDLLIPNMSIESHLSMFCYMNGMEVENTKDYVDLLLKSFGIQKFKEVACGKLSGGTKRKVSAAIAVMLPRLLVVLDEASTGLDPLARQKLWRTVKLLNRDRTTILTTHYINETSASDRIAIFSSGELRACGTEHDLAKRATGYKVNLQFAHVASNLEEFFKSSFPTYEARLHDVVNQSVTARLWTADGSIGDMILMLEKMKENGVILDYSLSRASLEEVYLEIVNTTATVQNPV